MQKFLKEQLPIYLAGALSAILLFFLVPFSKEASHAVSDAILTVITPKALLGLSCALCLVAILSWIYALWVRHSFSDEYRKKSYPRDACGLRYSRKDGTWICPRCFDRGEIAPLDIKQHDDHTHAECHVADCFFSNHYKIKIGDTKNVV